MKVENSCSNRSHKCVMSICCGVLCQFVIEVTNDEFMVCSKVKVILFMVLKIMIFMIYFTKGYGGVMEGTPYAPF